MKTMIVALTVVTSLMTASQVLAIQNRKPSPRRRRTGSDTASS